MENTELIKALKEDAEWAHANEWETPITLGDHLDAAVNALESLQAQLAAERAKYAELQRYNVDCTKACDRQMVEILELREQNAALAESQRREQAAVEDLKKHRKYKCDCCYYADKQGRYIPCRDCQSPISNYGYGWQWRGPQDGKEAEI